MTTTKARINAFILAPGFLRQSRYHKKVSILAVHPPRRSQPFHRQNFLINGNAQRVSGQSFQMRPAASLLKNTGSQILRSLG
jgi:hypothetical protein